MEMTPLAPFSFTNSGNVITARKQQANIEDDSQIAECLLSLKSRIKSV